MPSSYIILAVAAIAGIGGFIALRPNLTSGEKEKAFWLALGACPAVTAIAYQVLTIFHHDAYVASGVTTLEEANVMPLASFLGVVASGVVVWGVDHLSKHRTYAQFVEAQQAEARAKEYARRAAEEREERMQQGKIELARRETQREYLAMLKQQVEQEARVKQAALTSAEDRLKVAYRKFALSDPTMLKDEATLKAEFQVQARKPYVVSARDRETLKESQDPEVIDLLNRRPHVSRTDPD